jgi:nitrate/nitrite-specific signal transduction histidine kinase
MRISRSLRAKSALAALVPTVAVVLIATFVGLGLTDRAARGVVEQRDAELARITAERLSERLERQAEPLLRLAQQDGIRFGGEGVVDATLARHSPELAGFDGGVLLYDERGVVRASWPVGLARLPQWLNYPDRSQLADIRAGAPLAFSSVFVEPTQPRGVILVAVPVHAVDGSLRGILSGVIRLSGGILADVAEVRAGATGSAYVVDDRGRVIYHQDPELLGRNLAGEAPVARVIAGEIGALIGDNASGERVVAGYAPVGTTSWGVVTEEDWGTVISPLRSTAWSLLTLILIGAGISALVLVLAIGRVLSPIDRLSEAARALAAGQFDRRIDADVDDELAGLARQFNAMAEALSASYADLERRVEERTEENRRLYEEARERAGELEDLNRRLLTVGRTATEVAAVVHQDELVNSVVTRLRDTFDYRTVYVLLADRQTGALILQAGVGRPGLEPPRGLHVPHALIPDVSRDSRFKFFDEVRDTGSGLAVPIRAGDRLLGVLAIEQEQVGSLGEGDLVTAQVLADYLAVALENARLFEQTGDLAVLEERNRMAREIHDTIAQGLTGVVLQLEAAEGATARDPSLAAAHIERAKDLARTSLQEARRSVWNLLPRALEEQGLESALKTEVRSFSEAGPETATIEVEGEPRTLSSDVQVALLRIVQEGLTNARKHARAQHVRVRLAFARDAVSVSVEDDGAGFDDEAAARSRGRGGGFGLEGMTQRARLLGGTLDVGSGAQGGTRVEARIPLREDGRTPAPGATLSRA